MSNRTAVARFAPNTRGRDFVCGDIHGGWYLVEQALAECAFDEQRDRLFCVGDLVDRGPESARFPEFLDRDWFHAIVGNHEQMALRAVLNGDHEARMVWSMNGGDWIMDISPQHGRAMVEQLAGLPLAIELQGRGTEPVVLAHAGIHGNDWSRARQTLMDAGDAHQVSEPMHTLLWDRSRIQYGDDSIIHGARHVFHGHTVLKDVITLGNRTYLDLGSVMTGRFAILDIGRWLAREPGSRDGLHIVEG